MSLVEAIAARRARVGVIGQGYVGLPLALVFAEAGFSVGLGSNSAVQAQGYVSGPLADGVRGRLSLASERGGKGSVE